MGMILSMPMVLIGVAAIVWSRCGDAGVSDTPLGGEDQAASSRRTAR